MSITAGLLFVPAAAWAQAELLDAILKDFQQRIPGGLSGGIDPNQSLRSPLDPSLPPTPPGALPPGFATLMPPAHLKISRIEQDYMDRLGQFPLSQFGYDRLGSLNVTNPAMAGAVGDHYRLGVGDELIVTFRGQKNDSYRLRVDREGRVLLPEMAPILAAGRSFGEFRAEVEEKCRTTFLETDIFVSLGSMRSAQIYVLGEVIRPGVQQVSGLATALDAIAAAGGISENGSLRRIQLVRRTGQSQQIDLYDLLASGRLGHDLTMSEGDRIVVPTLGPTIAVAGEVRRPAIFELDGSGRIPGPAAVSLAGGPLRSGGYRYARLRGDAGGNDRVDEVDRLDKASLSNGDILLVLKGGDSQVGGFILDGHVTVPGIRSLTRYPTLGTLLRAGDAFKPNPYLLFAGLQTTDPVTLARHFVPVNLARIRDGLEDVTLKDGDALVVFGVDDVRYLSSADVQAVLQSRMPPSAHPFTPMPGQTVPVAAPAPPAPPGQGANPPPAGSGQPSVPPSLPNGQPNQPVAPPGMTMVSAGSAFTTPQLVAMVPPRPPARPPGAVGLPQAMPSQTASGNPYGVCAGLQTLAAVMAAGRSDRLANASQSLAPTGAVVTLQDIRTCPEIFERYPDLLPFLLEYAVALTGESRMPGAYPVLPQTPLSALIAVGGGLTREADMSNLEVTRFPPTTATPSPLLRENVDARRTPLQSVALSPGDVVRFNPSASTRDAGPILIAGEVRRPGQFIIHRGERLSEALARAGGLTEQAYPLGVVFTRERVKAQEKLGFDTAARDLETGMADALARSSIDPDKDKSALHAISMVVNDLKNVKPMGRVVVEADPAVLALRPELDPILEPGDQIMVPKRPSHVTITGEVLSAGTQQFESSLSVADYIRRAGGTRRTADESRTFVVLPNGQAQPVSVSAWNFSTVRVPPGSTIVVPRDPAPFDLTGFTKDMGEILSKLAITAASVAVIGR